MFKSLRSKFFLLTIINLIIMFIIVLFVYLNNQKDSLKEQALENSMNLSRMYASNFGLLINSHIKVLKTVASQPKTVELDKDYILNEMTKVLKDNEDIYLNAVYLTSEGIMYSADGSVVDVSESYFFDIFNNSNNDYEIIPVGIGTIFKVPRFSIGAVIRDEEGKNIGSLGISIDVFALSDSIKDLKLEGESYPWITDQYGRVAIHPNGEYPYYATLNDYENLGYSGFENISKSILNNEEGLGEYYDNNIKETKLITYAPIPYMNGWSLNITTIEKYIFKDVDEFINNSIIVVLMILFVTGFVYFQISSRIIKPLKDLADQVKARGDRKFIKVDLKTSTKEVSQLVDAHNQMTEELSEYTNHLEELVEKRTLELDELNNELNIRNDELQVAIDKLNVQAYKDSLTDLDNRFSLYRYLYRIIERYKNDNRMKFSLLFIDIDNFKYYNDTFGHDLGDCILKRISSIFKENASEKDFIARYGGDEFIIVINYIDINNSKVVIENINSEIDSYNNELLDHIKTNYDSSIEEFKYSLGISYGECELNTKLIKSPDEVIKLADEKMYTMKKTKKRMKRID